MACEHYTGRIIGTNLFGETRSSLRSSAMNIMRKMWTFLIFTSLLGSGSLFAQQPSGQEGSSAR